ncbi:uncharacterized protein LOC120704951 [Panicum virgatum]|uniref:uncharacterized protein LOC120704951 n=1 Tax=Panicum virgatum TaxID=38727 RepID=UPI0019D658F9|nr:uncharacterized protein LOC120704951 [Panicum virgatum]
MRQIGKSLKDYPEIELPNADDLDKLGNRLVNEQNSYDKDQLKDEHMTIHSKLNPDQRNAFAAIIGSVEKGPGKQIFVEGYGGTGYDQQLLYIHASQCNGCRNNGSPDMKHPNNTDAYTAGRLDGYLPFGDGELSGFDDLEAEAARLRVVFKKMPVEAQAPNDLSSACTHVARGPELETETEAEREYQLLLQSPSSFNLLLSTTLPPTPHATACLLRRRESPCRGPAAAASTAPPSEKLLPAVAESTSAITLLEPDVSSPKELLGTTSSEGCIIDNPQPAQHNTTDSSPPSASSLVSKILARYPRNWYQVFYIRMDRGGYFCMYPNLGGPFRSIYEADDAIERYLDELRHKAMCKDQVKLSVVDRLIHSCKFYLDGTPKRGPNSPTEDEKIYMDQAVLDQYNEDHNLFGGLVSLPPSLPHHTHKTEIM